MFVNCKSITRQHLERVIGLLNFACVANPLSRIYVKKINRFLRDVARVKNEDISIPLSLMLWLKPQKYCRVRFLDEFLPQMWNCSWMPRTLVGDSMRASQMGQSLWSPVVRTFHINMKEFMAIKKCRWKRGTSVRLHCDNTTVVNCLN